MDHNLKSLEPIHMSLAVVDIKNVVKIVLLILFSHKHWSNQLLAKQLEAVINYTTVKINIGT